VNAIQAAARRHDRVVAEAFMYRHHAQTLKVQELVKNGSLGALKLIRGSFSFVLTREGDVRLDPSMGGGSIWDVGCYPISYTRTVVGEAPLEVFGWQVTGPTGIDETFVGQMRFEYDIHAQFDCSFAIPFHSFLEIVGSEGTLSIPHPFKPESNEKIYLTRDGKTETIKIKGQELYLGEVEDMADAILLGRDPRISLDDSRANVAVILALLESARTGKPVKPDYGSS
jgi:predicted dehydrogenase